MVIYKATNLITGKVYIGQTTNLESRKKRHLYESNKSTTAFYKAIKKYGFDSFVWEVLAECDSRYEANTLEQDFIEKFGGVNSSMTYNETKGGHAFKTRKFSKKDRLEYSKRAKETKLNLKGSTPENIKKSVETRRRLGVYDKLSQRQKGENNVAKKSQVKKKISESVKKLWQSEDYRKNRKPKMELECPYCGIKSKSGVLKRWHFDNCKYK